MEIKPTKLLYYNQMEMINSNAYGKFAIGQAREWAELMEEQIKEKNLTKIEEIVEFMKENATKISLETKHCKEGLTGFQQDCATSLLVHSWKYGFELWLGLGLEKFRKNYHMDDELLEYVTYYNEGNIGAIITYKNKCDGRYRLEKNTIYMGGKGIGRTLKRLACYGGL